MEKTITFNSENKDSIVKAIDELKICLAEIEKEEISSEEINSEEIDLLKLIKKINYFNDWMGAWDSKLICKLERKGFVATKFYVASGIMGDVDSTQATLTQKGIDLLKKIEKEK